MCEKVSPTPFLHNDARNSQKQQARLPTAITNSPIPSMHWYVCSIWACVQGRDGRKHPSMCSGYVKTICKTVNTFVERGPSWTTMYCLLFCMQTGHCPSRMSSNIVAILASQRGIRNCIAICDMYALKQDRRPRKPHLNFSLKYETHQSQSTTNAKFKLKRILHLIPITISQVRVMSTTTRRL